ncbi:MAG: hypothetical protein ACLR4Z_17095 [Butyricicoccaceae bacterium]
MSPERAEKYGKSAKLDAEGDPTASTSVTSIAPGEQLNAFLEQHRSTPPQRPAAALIDLLRRPELSYADLAPFDAERPELPAVIREQVESPHQICRLYRAPGAPVSRQYRRLQSRPLPRGSGL